MSRYIILFSYYRKVKRLDKTEKEAKHYLQKFNQTQNNLKHLQKELDIREEALDFVTEVLTAERTNDESVSMLYKNVDSTVDFITGELRECLKSTNNLPISIKNKYFGQALTAWAINKKKTWIQGKITIAFVGEFSAGKNIYCKTGYSRKTIRTFPNFQSVQKQQLQFPPILLVELAHFTNLCLLITS